MLAALNCALELDEGLVFFIVFGLRRRGIRLWCIAGGLGSCITHRIYGGSPARWLYREFAHVRLEALVQDAAVRDASEIRTHAQAAGA